MEGDVEMLSFHTVEKTRDGMMRENNKVKNHHRLLRFLKMKLEQ